MPRVTDQRQFFRTESLEYLRRNFEGKDLRRLPLVPILEDFLAHTPPMDLENGSILDLGCGPGNNLFQLFTRYGAQRGVGTEPSPEAVSILTEAYPELEFYESTTDTLPFSTGEFDLILLRSVLHWVDRNYLVAGCCVDMEVRPRGGTARLVGWWPAVSRATPGDDTCGRV